MLSIPNAIATEVPKIAAKLQRREKEVIEFCQARDFSIARLSELMKRPQ